MLFKGSENSSLIARRFNRHVHFYSRTFVARKSQRKIETVTFNFVPIFWINNHYPERPPKYALILRCCYKVSCIHPICRSTTNIPSPITWSTDGPSIANVLPIPVIDEENPGHYCKRFTNIQEDKFAPVPSEKLALEFAENNQFDKSRIKTLATECLLKEETVQFYIKHLERCYNNRMKGVKKAQKTRALRSKQS